MRIDYYDDPAAPKANAIVPAAWAIIEDEEGRILLQQRQEDGLWSLPGGAMELGESITQTLLREVKEETGLDVLPEYLVGIYSDPRHVIALDHGEVRQQFSLCFACRIIGGSLQISSESRDLRFFSVSELDRLPMHRSSLLRIKDYQHYCGRPFIR
jgi:8-oxo-dGTP pyrophosphatase MutT (NUDIX family)